MAAIDFPSNPTLGQIFTASNKEWQWDGTAWQLVSSDTNVISTTLIDAKGDLIVGASADAVTRLGVGTNGQVLTASSTAAGGLVWQPATAGATGGGTDQVFYNNDQNVTTNYSIPSGKNSMSAGPVTINDGVTVTIPSGSVWTVV